MPTLHPPQHRGPRFAETGPFRSSPRVALRAIGLALAVPASIAWARDPRPFAAAIPATVAAPAPAERTLTIGAYTTPREVYENEILPAFREHWKKSKGEDVRFETSYLGSGAQARAIVGGFEADVAALSLAPDVETIRKADLITREWTAGPDGGMVSRSIVVIGVRKGNPKNLVEWDDLRRERVEVLTPNVKTSGGAMWNVLAIYGAAIRGQTSAKKGDLAGAEALLGGVLRNVRIMDKGARESIVTFETGVGDAIVTYENEILVGRKAGQDYEYVVPRSTILIENPVAVVDVYAKEHGVLDLAEAFVEFLATPESQRAFAAHGYRPVDEKTAAETAGRFPTVTDLFTVRDLGDWDGVRKAIFDRDAAYDRVMAGLRTAE